MAQPQAANRKISKKNVCRQSHREKMSIALSESRKIAEWFEEFARNGIVSNSYVESMKKCGSFASWLLTPNKNLRSLLFAEFCHKRLCPVCMIRRARREAVIYDELMRAAEEMCPANLQPVTPLTPLSPKDVGPFRFSDRPAVAFLLMTLTAESPDLDDLGRFCQAMAAGHRALTLQPFWKNNILGSIRKLGVTINSETGRPHPHYHYILAIPEYYLRCHKYPVSVSLVRTVWARTMEKFGYNVDIQHGVDIRFSDADKAYYKTYRKAIKEKRHSSAASEAEAARAQVIEDFLARQSADGEPAISKLGTHFPRELAQYMVQMWEPEEFDKLTPEKILGIHTGLKHVKITSYQGLFRQLRRRMLVGRLILKPDPDVEALRFRFIENYSEVNKGLYDVSYIDLGEDLPLKDARKVAKEILEETIPLQSEIQVLNNKERWSCEELKKLGFDISPELVPNLIPGVDYDKYIRVLYSISSSISREEKRSEDSFPISYYQRYRLLRFMAKNNDDLVSVDKYLKWLTGKSLFSFAMIQRVRRDFPAWCSDGAAIIASQPLRHDLALPGQYVLEEE